MTTTRSKVARVSEHEYRVLTPKARRIVCTIHPGDVLELRELGRRAKYRMKLETALRYAVQIAAFKIRNRIDELKKAGIGRADARRRAEREILT